MWIKFQMPLAFNVKKYTKRYNRYTKYNLRNPVKSRVSAVLKRVRLPSSPLKNPIKSRVSGHEKSKGIPKGITRYNKITEGDTSEWCFFHKIAYFLSLKLLEPCIFGFFFYAKI